MTYSIIKSVFRGPSDFILKKQRFSQGRLVYPPPPGGGEVLPYVGYIGMCRCEGYGFQAVYSWIGYINQRVWV